MADWKDWLAEAKNDLITAESSAQAGIYAQACFHCQQAVEKALKALLLKRENEFPKIHSLRKLAEKAGVLLQLRDMIAILDIDYTTSRYSDFGAEPPRKLYSRKTFEEHFEASQHAYEMIVQWTRI